MRKIFFTLVCATMALHAPGQQASQLSFSEETFDFGNVEEEQGPVIHEFVFTNNSGRPMKIIKVQASCGCTTPAWTREVVAPGKQGFIQASFNPKGRPGFFNKTLTVTTDLDPNPVILQIKGQVTHDEKPVASDYPVSLGSLRMKLSSFNMGRVYVKDEFSSREFAVMNGGAAPLHFTGKFVAPPYIRIDVQPRTLAPGEKASVRVSYNGAKKNQYGFQSDNIELETDDKAMPMKAVTVYASLEDYFPDMSGSELARSPQLSLEPATLDFGKIRQNVVATREVRITNTGKQELLIKSLQPNCTCITAELNVKAIKPGESATLRVGFNPQTRSGTQHKSIALYTNDPRNPVQRLTFTAFVE